MNVCVSWLISLYRAGLLPGDIVMVLLKGSDTHSPLRLESGETPAEISTRMDDPDFILTKSNILLVMFITYTASVT